MHNYFQKKNHQKKTLEKNQLKFGGNLYLNNNNFVFILFFKKSLFFIYLSSINKKI